MKKEIMDSTKSNRENKMKQKLKFLKDLFSDLFEILGPQILGIAILIPIAFLIQSIPEQVLKAIGIVIIIGALMVIILAVLYVILKNKTKKKK